MPDKYIDLSHTTRPGSLAPSSVTATITGATAANPVVVTAVAHGFSNADIVGIDGVLGMVELNDITYTVANKADDTFELEGINGTGFTAYTSGGVATKLMGVTGDIRLLYDDSIKPDRLVTAVQRAKEALAEILT